MRYLVYILLFFGSLSALQAQSKLPQNLLSLGDEELLALFNEMDGDSIAQERVARTYLNRARKEKDTIKMARGYDRLARIFHPEKNIMFADSVISLTENKKHITYPALGYILRGYNYNEKGDFVQAMNEYFRAYFLAKEYENINQQVYILDVLISAKSVWGDKKEALSLQRKRHKIVFSDDFFAELRKSTRKGFQEKLNTVLVREKLSSYENFVFCFINLKLIDSAQIYLKKSYEELNKYDGNDRELHFDWLEEAQIDITYLNESYEDVISKSQAYLKNFPSSSSDSKFNIYMLQGFSLLKLNNEEEGIKYLLKADSIYRNFDLKIYPADRELFIKLYEHYINKNNTNKQIEYLNHLLKMDSIFKLNYQYFEPQMIKAYETPRLLSEKEDLINRLRFENRRTSITNWLIVVLLIIMTFGLYFYFKRQLIYKRRFEQLIAYSLSEDVQKTNTQLSNNQPSSDLIEHILNSLSDFEKKREYLSQKISLGYLAKRFDTNSK